MSHEVCPGCGSKINIANGFFCGTKYWNNGWHRSADCYRNQIANLQTKIAALPALVQEMGEVLHRIDKIDWHSKSRDDKRERICEICGVMPGHASNCIAVVSNKILNRPEVRKIMEAPE